MLAVMKAPWMKAGLIKRHLHWAKSVWYPSSLGNLGQESLPRRLQLVQLCSKSRQWSSGGPPGHHSCTFSCTVTHQDQLHGLWTIRVDVQISVLETLQIANYFQPSWFQKLSCSKLLSLPFCNYFYYLRLNIVLSKTEKLSTMS